MRRDALDEKEIIANLVRIAEDEGVWAIEVAICPPGGSAEAQEAARRYAVRMGTLAVAAEDEPGHPLEPNGAPEARPADAGRPPARVPEVVRSPLVGIFHRSLEPGGPPLVETGSVVEVDQTLCCVECLKVFREVSAAVAGRITAVLAENEEAVDYGQPLFEVFPERVDDD